MATVMYEHASFARFEAEQVTLCLSARLFRGTVWDAINVWLQPHAREVHWLSEPFRLMTAEGDGQGCPRWKQVGVDALSWIIFHLLVPVSHPLVKLWRAIDWAAVNRVCTPLYCNSQSGQRAWAPAQMFALLLLFFVLSVSSECELLRVVAIVPLYRWFCGFGLFSKLPDHSTLHTFRKRVGVERFEAILTWIVHRCLDVGLIADELVHFDMMGVAASARAWTPYERAVLLTYGLIRYLELVEEGEAPNAPLSVTVQQLAAEVAVEVLGNKRLQKDPKSPARVLKSLEGWAGRRQAANGQALWEMTLEEAVQIQLAEVGAEAMPALQESSAARRWLKKIAQYLKGRLPHACGDLDARVGWVNDVLLLCGYWLGFLVDGRQGVITAVRLVPLNIAQHAQMLPAVDSHRHRVGAYPKAVAADSAQDYYPVHRGLDRRQVQGHIASREHKAPGGGLSSDHFTWDERGQLRCPQGHTMKAGKRRKDGMQPFRAKAAVCASCPRKTECLPKGQQEIGRRLIHLEPDAHQRWLQNRAHTRTEAYKKAQKKRFASERWFGLAERLYKADKMSYRSTAMNQIAGLMVAIAMNLALLAQHGELA